jgi:hypothetical protein
MQVDTGNFDLRNIEMNQSGELSVRHGAWLMNNILSPDSSALTSSSFDAQRAISVKSQFVDDIQIYAIGNSEFNGNLWLQILDETLSYANRKQIINLGKARQIRAMTSAVVNGQLIISGPDIPTLWGYTGSGLIFAEKQESINVTTETLSMPNGICASWAGRCVIAKGEALFVSDPLAPRTYTAGGVVTLPGICYGLHVSPEGSLIAVTSNGVYGLSSQAAAQGQAIIGSLQKLSNYKASDYNCSCLTPKGLYGLTERGVVRIDVDGAEDILLSDGSYVRALTDMISFPSYRVGEVFETQRGLCVSMGTLDEDADGEFSGGLCMVDFNSNTKSWWTTRGMTRVRSIFESREGEDTFLFEGAAGAAPFSPRAHVITFDRIGRNYGGGTNPVKGFVSGLVPTSLEISPVVRHVWLSSDNGGQNVSCAVRGEYIKNNGTLQEAVTAANGVVVGVDFWADSMTDSRRYKTAELKRTRFSFAKKTNDISLEAGAEGSTSRLRVLNMDVAGYGVNTA